MKRLTLFLITVFFVGISVAGVKYVAVVETEIDARSGASAELTSAEVALITAELRREAVNNLPQGAYSVMTSETVHSMGGAVLEECADENCVITLGSKIGADYIVRGTISKLRALFTLSVEIYETDNGTLLASSDPVRSERIEELVDKAAIACASMYRKFAGGQSAVAQIRAQESVAARPPAPSQPQYTPAPVYSERYKAKAVFNEQHDDFTAGERWGTWALNVVAGLRYFEWVGNNYIIGAEEASLLWRTWTKRCLVFRWA